MENRAIWIVQRICSDGLELQSLHDPTDSRHISYEYAGEFVHLAYAPTVHGIQGETTHTSLVGPGVDAAGLYVGLTRGRHTNEAVVIASSEPRARAAIAETMMRGLPESELIDARRAAVGDLRRSATGPDHASASRDSRVPSGSNVPPIWCRLTRSLRSARRKLLEAKAHGTTLIAQSHLSPSTVLRESLDPQREDDLMRIELEARVSQQEDFVFGSVVRGVTHVPTEFGARPYPGTETTLTM